jgi:hypothetical protein
MALLEVENLVESGETEHVADTRGQADEPKRRALPI